MKDFMQKILDFLLGPESIMAEPGFDPSQEGLKTRAQRKTALIALILLGGIFVCIVLAVGVSKAIAAARATPTPEPTWTPEATLAAPGITFQPNFTAIAPVDTSLPNDLTEMASSPTATHTPTQINMGNIQTSIALQVTSTSCAASGQALTEIACNSVSLTETMRSVGIGTPVSASGIDLNSTTIYVYPTPYPPTQTPWIIEASPTQTPVVITATPGPTQTPWVQVQVVTAIPGPTQTPWFFITQPPVVTVVWTQLVPVTVIVNQTVVVTATPTDTQPPTDTPMPMETPTP